MRCRVAALALLLAACNVQTTPTTQGTVSTLPDAEATTTTAPGQDYTVQGCISPQVTFSALCEIHELIHIWHVDRPVDDSRLAAAAIEAIDSYVVTETAPRPRTLQCAVPSNEFEPMCASLAELVLESEAAVGPAVEAAVLAMADFGLDPFSYYVPPDQVGAFRANGVVGGVGVLLDARDAAGSKCARISDSCLLEIVYVVEDNPGEAAGLMAGDVIVAVDGEPTIGKGFAATAVDIAGEETGVVELTVQRESGSLIVAVERDELEIPTVIVDLPVDDIGYLRIPDFEDDIPDLVDEALTSLSEFRPDTIVIDLRDNPGGLIDSAINVADQFIDGGVIIESHAPDEFIEYTASGSGLALSPRLIVLVNQGTASAAEILAASLRERRGALVIGSATFGKDAVQIPFDLRNGGEMFMAVARWQTPAGISVSEGGLLPDVEYDWPVGLTNEEIVEAALEAGQ